ncbi:MAG: protease inhibitor I42 family protein [Nitrospirales bacterium]|nr:protease inhibitor I42 family protein [Nitrospira sp.]MDR4500135.1 protease inhibitor I42 family protein [Nitrospirales bacterium]
MSEREKSMERDSQHARTLHVKKGELFSVNLWEDRTRGEQWVPTFDTKVCILVEDEFLRTISNNAVDSGRRRFEFQVMEPGTHMIEFSKRMAWKFTEEDRRIFIIHVDM